MRGAHMKMDNQHTGPDWQNAKTGGWNAPPDMADMDDLFDTSDPFLVPDQQPDADPETSEDEAAEDWAAPPFFSKESLGRLGRQFSPVLIPIPFALLIFLFTLPALLHNFSHLPLIPLVSALLVVVVLQGVALYYAGADDGRWMLSVVSGYALFLLIWAFALGGLLGSLLMLAFLLIIGGVIGRRAIHVVSEGAADIVLSFGKYSRTLFPGLNFLLPWEKVATRVNTREITWTSNEISMQISRDQEARIVVVVTYQVLPEDAHLVALQMQDWKRACTSILSLSSRVFSASCLPRILSPGRIISFRKTMLRISPIPISRRAGIASTMRLLFVCRMRWQRKALLSIWCMCRILRYRPALLR